jgi:hypothetical protein
MPGGRVVPQMAVSSCTKAAPYSITSSARASSVAGTWSPSALAAFKLMTNSAREKRGHAGEGIVPRRGIGAGMGAATAVAGISEVGQRVSRQVRVVEIMIGAGIEHNRDRLASRTGGCGQSLAGLRRRPVVSRAD